VLQNVIIVAPHANYMYGPLGTIHNLFCPGVGDMEDALWQSVVVGDHARTIDRMSLKS